MKRTFFPPFIVFCISLLVSACLFAAETGAPKKLLYITTTAGFHHSACEYSIPVIKKIAGESKKDPTMGTFEVVCSAKTDLITAESLKNFDGICFSNTTGDLNRFPLSEKNRNALISFVKEGKAFIGIHATTDTYKDWKPFCEMIGGSFIAHPWHEEIIIDIEDPAHPAMSSVPSPWVITDEIYTFKNYSRDKVHVLMSMNKKSFKGKGNRKDNDYALAWCKTYGKGRVFYSALGHRHEVWDDPAFQAHLLGGIRWALGPRSRDWKNGDGERVGKVKGNAKCDAVLTVGHKKLESEWKPIFDGKTLAFGTDWETTDDAKQTRKHWTVQPGGILQGEHVKDTPGSSHIYYTKESFNNFEVRSDIYINGYGNSGFYFRCARERNLNNGRWKNWPNGYESQVNMASGDPKRSGTFYPKPTMWTKDIKAVLGYDAPKNPKPGKEENPFWFKMHIIAVGDHIVIKLNNKIVTDHFTTRGLKEGLFSFQFHHPGTFVQYKNIEVRRLNPDLR